MSEPVLIRMLKVLYAKHLVSLRYRYRNKRYSFDSVEVLDSLSDEPLKKIRSRIKHYVR